jgi:hypothetical protein
MKLADQNGIPYYFSHKGDSSQIQRFKTNSFYVNNFSNATRSNSNSMIHS